MLRTVSVVASLVLLSSACNAPIRSARVLTKEHRQPVEAAAPLAASPPPMATADAASGSTEIEIHFINVGQGDSTLVNCPNGDTILVDCGSNGNFKRSNVRKYLRDALAEPRIDLLVITHPDSDHYNKVETVLESGSGQPEIEVGKVVYVGSMAAHGVAHFDDWLRDLPTSKREKFSNSEFNVFPTKSIDICGDVLVSVLAAGVPETDSSLTSSNALSIVLLVRHGDFDAILPGDATRTTQQDILKRFKDNMHELEGVEVLKVSHHGSKNTSLLPKDKTTWFDAIEPEVAIFSASKSNGHGHPNEDIADAIDGYTIEADRHSLRLWKKRGKLSTKQTINKYREEAMFLTATNGNVVIWSDGTWYDWAINN